MVLQTSPLPVTESDDAIRDALKDAFVPCLLAALALTLDDERFVPESLRPTPIADPIEALFDQTGGFSAQQTADGRELCFDGLVELRARQKDGSVRAYANDARHDALVRRCVEWLTGGTAGEDYVPLCIEELAPFGQDPRMPKWKAGPVSETQVQGEPEPAKVNEKQGVIIIGSGMSGILASIRCKQAGIPFVVLEKVGRCLGPSPDRPLTVSAPQTPDNPEPRRWWHLACGFGGLGQRSWVAF